MYLSVPRTLGLGVGFGPVRLQRTHEVVVEQLVAAIREGDLGVGDRLPSERRLARQMAVSRSALREAIKVLVEAGVLTVKPGPAGGMFVRSEVIPARVLAEATALRLSDVAGLLETRRLLEPRVAQLAALYGTKEDFEGLVRNVESQRNADGRP